MDALHNSLRLIRSRILTVVRFCGVGVAALLTRVVLCMHFIPTGGEWIAASLLFLLCFMHGCSMLRQIRPWPLDLDPAVDAVIVFQALFQAMWQPPMHTIAAMAYLSAFIVSGLLHNRARPSN